MDDDALNMRNWGYYEPSFKGHLGLQLMTSMAERDTKPFIPGRDPNLMVTPNAAFHPRDCIVSEAPIPMHYVRDTWISQREPQPPGTSTRDERVVGRVEEPPASQEDVQSKRRLGRVGPKTPKVKKPRKPKDDTKSTVHRSKPAKKSMDIKINGYDVDISGIPIPVCSCTGTAQQCYRWGCGGWQSACCTTTVSLTNEHQKAWRKDSRPENESGGIQEGPRETC
ncbi:rd22-b protein precursor [Hibiscus syriacus]|uniref:GAGA-binding transcriptional activator n=1 Tax=Hibiscus syriacus TaxID=106335 RepID=A0A6A3CMI7_HIBSY|nr:rd22-b protein precursor [Hibiscus syriacus]